MAALRQALLAEATRLRARGLAAQPGVSASSAPPLAKPAFASAAASSAEQPASINAVPSRVVRPVEFANGKRCLDACTSCESGEETSAAQPGSNARSLPVESRYEVSRWQRGHHAEPLRHRIRKRCCIARKMCCVQCCIACACSQHMTNLSLQSIL